MKKKSLLVVSALCVSATAALATRGYLDLGLGRVGEFTIAQEEKHLTDLPDKYGMVIPSEESVRSDGSFARTISLPGPNGGRVVLRQIHDFHEGKRTVVDDLTQSIQTTSLPKQAPKRNCILEDVKPSKLLGYDVYPKTIQFTEETRTEMLVAPALNCRPLEKKVFKKLGDGKMYLMNHLRVKSVVVDSPDPNRFLVPAHYAELSPAAATTKYNKLYPNARPRSVTADDRLEKVYQESHADLLKR